MIVVIFILINFDLIRWGQIVSVSAASHSVCRPALTANPGIQFRYVLFVSSNIKPLSEIAQHILASPSYNDSLRSATHTPHSDTILSAKRHCVFQTPSLTERHSTHLWHANGEVIVAMIGVFGFARRLRSVAVRCSYIVCSIFEHKNDKLKCKKPDFYRFCGQFTGPLCHAQNIYFFKLYECMT